MSKYIIGIDLGTTNSALATIDLSKKVIDARPKIQGFPMPQLVNPGETAERTLLPSFLYLPGEHDLPPGATILPWDEDLPYAVGEFARNQGAKIPGRLVSSAKSWLSHTGVDRSAPLLPWTAPKEVERVSPVEASHRYLQHMVDAWNHTKARSEEDRLENQQIVLTVPASFDDTARTLTVEAAKDAGLENLTLLEEPQAAFYCWLATHTEKEAHQLKPGYRCAVIDIGGGTTDFSLIEAVEEKGELAFVRQAVGNHLLLGGDNMDLALAHFVEQRLFAGKEGKRLDAAQHTQLTQGCRQAKEVLLGEKPPKKQRVSVMGRGRSVIGKALHNDLTPDEVRQVIVDGFFPITRPDEMPQSAGRTGLHEMGLPYVHDAAISRHLAEFLYRHIPRQKGEVLAAPEAILFNGGVFQPKILRDRVVEVMRGWFGKEWEPLVLNNPSLDLAVSLGAAQYGWLRHTGGKRIGGGIARSYYLGIDSGEQSSEDKENVSILCVVPQHLEEGEEVVLEEPELELALGQPVQFPLFTSTVRGDDQAGELLQVHPDQLLQLPPLHTVLRGGKRAGTKRTRVHLAARSTEIGTLELFCVAKEGDNRWRLEFNTRDLIVQDETTEHQEQTQGVTDIWPEHLVQEAARLLKEVYTEETPPMRPQELTNALENALEAARKDWPTGLCRRLWELLSDEEILAQRRRSPAHSNRWYNLVGYCLRPGFGDSLDRFRVEQLWKMLLTPPTKGKKGAKGPEGGAQVWIMWRRVSGGLQTNYQQALFDRMRGVLVSGKGRGGFKPDANELAEMWRAAASFERLDASTKEDLGKSLLKKLRRSPVPTYGFWALTRLGARSPLYGPLNTVVHPNVVEGWLDTILSFQPGNESEEKGFAFCLSQLARRTGQRALDIDESHQRAVLSILQTMKIPKHWVQGVEEVIELEAEEQSQMFGESLPIGLRLVNEEG